MNVEIIRISCLCFIIGLLAGCSDDYLDAIEQQPTKRSDTALYITPSSGYIEYNHSVPDAGNNTYSIGMFPKWLTFKYLKGGFNNNVVTLKFTVQNVGLSLAPGTYESKLVLVIENIGVHEIPVYLVIDN